MSNDAELFGKEMKDAHEKLGTEILKYLGNGTVGGIQPVSLERVAAVLITMERCKVFLTETLIKQGIPREALDKLITAGKPSDEKIVNDLLDKNKDIYEENAKKNRWAMQPPSAGG